MSLIKVFTEIEDGVTTCLPAKIISTKGDKYTIVYLSATDNRDSHNRKIYKYEEDTYEITNESITEFVNSDMEIDFGFKQISEDEFIKYDSDSDDDYVPSSDEGESSDSDSESESCDDDDDVSDLNDAGSFYDSE